MILRFYAKADLPVPLPGQSTTHGAPVGFVGRTQIMGTAVNSKGDTVPQAGYPATEKPYEVDSESDAGRRLRLICWRDESLYPADKETAEHCQVKFTDVVFSNGTWAEKPAKAAK